MFLLKRFSFGKLLSLLMLLLLVQLIVYLILEYRFNSEEVYSRLFTQGIKDLNQKEEAFQQYLRSKEALLNALKDNSQFQSLSSQNRKQVEELFLTLAISQPTIMQLRYIGASGREVIRIDRTAEGSSPFINPALQDKSLRDYFQQAKTAIPGKIIYSKLDLNVENNKVQVPFVPTVRIMLPLEKEGGFDGVLIINLFMKNILGQWGNSDNYDLIIADKDGYPILHYDPSRNWGAYRNPPYSLKDEPGSDFDTFIAQPELKMETSYAKKLSLPLTNELYVLFKINHEYLEQTLHNYLNRSLMMLFVLFFLALASSYFIAKDIYILMKDLRRQKELAEVSSRSKADFLANMSHEIRTPMQAILGFVEQLAKPEQDLQRIKQFKLIKDAGRTLLSIINDILDFSKIESGKLALEWHPVDIRQLLSDVAALLTEKMEEKKILFRSDINEHIPELILLDEVRFKQVLFNLLSNAIKFTPEKGKITCELSYDSQIQNMLVSIQDNGIGIAKENQEKIFKAFDQEDNSTTRKFGGTGLGLSISYKIIELMGGILKVESAQNQGSRFFFEIRVKTLETPTESFKSSEIEADTHLSRFEGTVLIVEDNKTNQLLLSMILDDAGIAYDIADDGIQAVEKVYQKRYDLIFMDENMPNMNGIEATQQIRIWESDHQLRPTPIIAVTANALKEDQARFLEAGMNDYISKPYSETDIMLCLQKYSSFKE